MLGFANKDMGQDYGKFDSAVKKIFIDQIEQIAERWKAPRDAHRTLPQVFWNNMC